jgi:hypothetical protein
LFYIELTRDEAIRFKDLNFITDHLNNLRLLPEGDNSSTMVGGIARSGSPSLHAILKEVANEEDLASCKGKSSSFPTPMVCNVVTPATPIITIMPSEETPGHQTIPAVPQRVAIPRSDTRPLLKQLAARQEE